MMGTICLLVLPWIRLEDPLFLQISPKTLVQSFTTIYVIQWGEGERKRDRVIQWVVTFNYVFIPQLKAHVFIVEHNINRCKVTIGPHQYVDHARITISHVIEYNRVGLCPCVWIHSWATVLHKLAVLHKPIWCLSAWSVFKILVHLCLPCLSWRNGVVFVMETKKCSYYKP